MYELLNTYKKGNLILRTYADDNPEEPCVDVKFGCQLLKEVTCEQCNHTSEEIVYSCYGFYDEMDILEGIVLSFTEEDICSL